MADTHQERTEQPTSRRRQRAREHGEVPRSRELQSALVLLVAVLGLQVFGPWMTHQLLERWAQSFTTLANTPLSETALPGLAATWMSWAAKLLLPLFLTVATAAIVAGAGLQGGFVFSAHGLTPNLSRIDPFAGARRLFSGKAGFGVGRDLVKIVLVGWVCATGVREAIATFTTEADVGVAALLGRMTSLSGTITLRATIVLVLVGLADYAYQRHRYTQDLRMTKQEIRQEMKETEGDPRSKNRIRSRQRELARRRMFEAIPTADVVLTNPTTLAVALKYDPEAMHAPRIVAKGQRLVAERIKELARQHGVPVIEDKPLARSLYRLADVGQEIPSELYRAVAEVLGFVYRQKGRVAAPPRDRDGGER